MNLDHTNMTDQAAADLAYHERNRLVAALARLYPSGLKKTAIEGWDPEWHNCVFIHLPTGQASWHYHDCEAYLFAGLPPYEGDWDGHTTEEKYARLAAIADVAPAPSLFQRFLIFLGVMKWCRGAHTMRETHGYEREQTGARFACCYCPATKGGL